MLKKNSRNICVTTLKIFETRFTLYSAEVLARLADQLAEPQLGRFHKPKSRQNSLLHHKRYFLQYASHE